METFTIIEIPRSSTGIPASLVGAAGERQEKQQHEKSLLHKERVL